MLASAALISGFQSIYSRCNLTYFPKFHLSSVSLFIFLLISTNTLPLSNTLTKILHWMLYHSLSCLNKPRKYNTLICLSCCHTHMWKLMSVSLRFIVFRLNYLSSDNKRPTCRSWLCHISPDYISYSIFICTIWHVPISTITALRY